MIKSPLRHSTASLLDGNGRDRFEEKSERLTQSGRQTRPVGWTVIPTENRDLQSLRRG